MSWAGIFNTEFWIDPRRGVGGVLLMQYLPFYDAAAIATLIPSLIGHGKIVGHEAPTVFWWSLAILLALGIHDGAPKPRTLAIRLAVLGAVIGLAVASRFVSGLVGPLCVIIVMVQAPDRQRSRKGLLPAWPGQPAASPRLPPSLRHPAPSRRQPPQTPPAAR